jgi:hypothetical protein
MLRDRIIQRTDHHYGIAIGLRNVAFVHDKATLLVNVAAMPHPRYHKDFGFVVDLVNDPKLSYTNTIKVSFSCQFLYPCGARVCL